MLHDAGVQYVICDETETAQALIPVIEEALGGQPANPITQSLRKETARYRTQQ